MARHIIGVCGFLNAGKSTVADHLVRHHGYTRMSFAGAVKDVVAALFQWDRALLDGATQESRVWRTLPDPYWSACLEQEWTPRRALQIVGTELGRQHLHENIWVDTVFAAINRLDPAAKVVIDDVRFVNELNTIHANGGTILRVFREFPTLEHEQLWKQAESQLHMAPSTWDSRLRRLRFWKNWRTQTPALHASEWDWLRWPAIASTPCLHNTGTKEEFCASIESWYTTLS